MMSIDIYFIQKVKKSKTINGFVQFKKPDIEKATNIFNELLKSISFKK